MSTENGKKRKAAEELKTEPKKKFWGKSFLYSEGIASGTIGITHVTHCCATREEALQEAYRGGAEDMRQFIAPYHTPTEEACKKMKGEDALKAMKEAWKKAVRDNCILFMATIELVNDELIVTDSLIPKHLKS